MQKYTKYVRICKNHPRHLYKFLLGGRGEPGSEAGGMGRSLFDKPEKPAKPKFTHGKMRHGFAETSQSIPACIWNRKQFSCVYNFIAVRVR